MCGVAGGGLANLDLPVDTSVFCTRLGAMDLAQATPAHDTCIFVVFLDFCGGRVRFSLRDNQQAELKTMGIS